MTREKGQVQLCTDGWVSLRVISEFIHPKVHCSQYDDFFDYQVSDVVLPVAGGCGSFPNMLLLMHQSLFNLPVLVNRSMEAA